MIQSPKLVNVNCLWEMSVLSAWRPRRRHRTGITVGANLSVALICLLLFPPGGDTKSLLGVHVQYKVYTHKAVFCSPLFRYFISKNYYNSDIFAEKIVNYLLGFCSVETFAICFNFTNKIYLL